MLGVVANELLHLADGELFGGRAQRERHLRVLFTEGEERAAVPRLDLPLGEQPLHLRGELEEPDRVRDVRARHAEALGERLLRRVELV